MRQGWLISIFIVFWLLACGDEGADDGRRDACQLIEQPSIDRQDYIPVDALKMSPDEDPTPPVLHLAEMFHQPVPLNSTINTAGAEDSAFFAADTDTLYFWFTPDVKVAAEDQALDPSTGIYQSRRQAEEWQSPEKVWLFNTVSLEGCACVQGNTIWYCAAVCGMTGLRHFYSVYESGNWLSGQLSEILNRTDYEIGEFHVTSDANEIYFHSARAGGHGGNDLWKIEKTAAGWGDPVPLTSLNTAFDEGFPFVTADGTELWFSGDSRIDVALPLGTPDYFGALFYSIKEGDSWGAPVEVVSQLAGEPTVDSAGNVYFTHHYYVNEEMIEADIYVLRRK
jgi:hypothetical protein